MPSASGREITVVGGHERTKESRLPRVDLGRAVE